MDTAVIHGLQILSVGTWDGLTGRAEILPEHLDLAVKHLQENPNYRAPVKLGHGSQTILKSGGMPAAGYITRLWREGDKLLADISDVPARLAELFKRGAWRNRSAELSWTRDEDGKITSAKLTGLALLGSTLPAVENLADIEALYTRLSLAKEDDSVAILFEAKDEPQMTSAGEAMVLLEDYFNGRTDGPDLRALARVIQTGVTTRRHEVDDTKIRAALGLGEDASEEDVLTAVEKLKAPAADSAQTTALSQANVELSARVVALETTLAQRDAADLVEQAIRDGKIAPASRESSMTFALSAPAAFKTFVESQPKIVEFSEQGSSQGDTSAQTFEPTAEEIRLGAMVGVSANDLRVQKYMDAGLPVPTAVLAAAGQDK